MKVITRYILAHYLRVFALCMASGAGIFLVIDLLDRVASYSEYAPTWADMASFYVFRLPRILTEIYPAVALLAVLMSLGLLARHREILALRACGIGTWTIALPLIVASLLLSLAVLIWNESVVPATALRARHIKDVVIKKKNDFGLQSARSIWFQDARGFVSIDYFDANRETVHGLTRYETDRRFRLQRIVEVPVAYWRGDGWRVPSGSVKVLRGSAVIDRRPLAPADFRFEDTPSDLAKKSPNAEEFTFAELRAQISILRAKGLDARELEVDLHTKIAQPFAGLVGVLLGLPLAVRGGRRFGLAYNAGIGMATGFAYWVTMGVAMSAGRMGVIPPLPAAWAANLLFALIGAALYRRSDV